MNAAQWWIFLPACVGMNFFPGPNNLLALVHGTRTTAQNATIAGLARLPVMVVMLVLLALGLEALLALSANAFQWLRIVGAASPLDGVASSKCRLSNELSCGD